jgi:hypothetical protein
VTFHKVELVEVTGFGEFTRPNDEAAKKAAELRSTVWRPLFDGKNLDGWSLKGAEGVDASVCFTITERDGQPVLCIRDKANGAILGNLHPSFRNYQLHIEYQCGAGDPREFGLQLTFHNQGSRAGNSFELRADGKSGYLRTWGNRVVRVGQLQEGALVPAPGEPMSGLVAPLRKAEEKPPGEWNTVDLICLDSTSLFVQNGKVLTVIAEFRGSSDDKGAVVTSGAIGFHAVRGEFVIRSIQIRPITAIPPEFLK